MLLFGKNKNKAKNKVNKKGIQDEIYRLEENLRTMSVDDEQYAATVQALERLYTIQRENRKDKRSIITVIADVAKVAGIIGLGAYGLALSYEKDHSDEPMYNKNTEKITSKFLKFW